ARRVRLCRYRRRLVDLLGPAGRRAAGVGRARAQVLLRRAVQRALLLAGGRGFAPPPLDGRGADRERLDRRRSRPDPPRRWLVPRAPDGPRPRVRVLARRGARRPHPRLHRGAVMGFAAFTAATGSSLSLPGAVA